MKKSYWHFERADLKNRMVKGLEAGLVQSMILFAPRRIGKTEFLEYDLRPALEELNYRTIYFSFFTDSGNKVNDFVNFLRKQLNRSIFDKIGVKELNFSWCRISIDKWKPEEWSILDLLTLLSVQVEKESQLKLVLMLDEVQELQNSNDGNNFIGGLRTALDKNKERISVIFTGSSQDGLSRMFNEKRAPFFHFGLNIILERFNKEFTDFLADRFKERVGVAVDKGELYAVFCKFDRVTEYIRQIINQLILEPETTLNEAYENYMEKLFDIEKFEKLWNDFSNVEKSIYLWIKNSRSNFYTEDFKNYAMTTYKLKSITNNQIQYALSKLLKNQHLATGNESTYTLNNTLLTKWLDLELPFGPGSYLAD